MMRNMDNALSNPAIGPREDRELELMLAGTKPLAMFYDVVPASIELPEADFAPYIDAGRILKHETIYISAHDDVPTRYIYYALPCEGWRIDKICKIHAAIYAGEPRDRMADDIKIGRLLGYSEAEIAAYLEWVPLVTARLSSK